MKTRIFLLALWTTALSASDQKTPLVALDINTATVEELEQLPSIGRSRAEMIVRIRERNGPFKRVEELRALPRLSQKQFRQCRPYLTVRLPTEGSARTVSGRALPQNDPARNPEH